MRHHSDLRPARLGLGVLLALSVTGNAAAQVGEPETGCTTAVVLPAECYRRLDLTARAERDAERAPDHRFEGLAIGGGLGLVGGVLFGAAICRHVEGPDESCAWPAVRGGIGGGVLLGLLGLLIGAQFPKESKEPVRADSVSRDTVPP